METVTDPGCPSEPTVVAVLERAWGWLLDESHWHKAGGFFEVEWERARASSDLVCKACAIGACAIAAAELSGEKDMTYSSVYKHVGDSVVGRAWAALDNVVRDCLGVAGVAALNDSQGSDHESIMQVFESTLKNLGVENPQPITEVPA